MAQDGGRSALMQIWGCLPLVLSITGGLWVWSPGCKTQYRIMWMPQGPKGKRNASSSEGSTQGPQGRSAYPKGSKRWCEWFQAILISIPAPPP